MKNRPKSIQSLVSFLLLSTLFYSCETSPKNSPNAMGANDYLKPREKIDAPFFLRIVDYSSTVNSEEIRKERVHFEWIQNFSPENSEASKTIEETAKVGDLVSITNSNHLHLGIIIPDKKTGNKLVFTTEPKVGIALKPLNNYQDSWIRLYRIKTSKELDIRNLLYFVSATQEFMKKWEPSGFSGIIGLTEVGLFPKNKSQVSNDYICSTLVVAAYQYAGIKLHISKRKSLFDYITPRSVIHSSGQIIDKPQIHLVPEKITLL